MEPGRKLGTWLALDTSGRGRVAALLNVTGAGASSERQSRGHLVANLVRGAEPMADYFQRLRCVGPQYNPFHLVAIDLDPSGGGLWHYSNVPEQEGEGAGAGADTPVTHITEGCFSLGNSPLSRPFRKVVAGEERFQECVEKWGRQDTRDQLVDEMVHWLLKWDKEHYPDDEMEARGLRSNLSPGSMRRSCAVFQHHPDKEYGTRTHTVILVDSDWRCDFHEWTKEVPSDPASKWIHTYEVVQLDR